MKKQVLTFILGISLYAHAQEGILDATFATSGVFKTDDNRDIYATDIQSDGKIVLVGSRYDVNGSDVGVFRHNSNGSIDNSFGTNGAAIIDFFGKQDIAKGVKVLPNGKIIVGAIVTEGTTKKYALIKLNADGSLDNSFGTAGKVVTNIPGATALFLSTMTVSNDGKIILGGSADGFSKSALAVYTSTGDLDVTFDTDGIIQPTSVVEIRTIKIQSDGKILISGGGSLYASVARLNANGSFDNSFGTNGVFANNTLTPGGANTYFDLTADEKIVGIFGSFALQELTMFKLTSAGKLDSSFGTSGKKTIDVMMGSEYPTVCHLQANGKFLVTGSDGGSANIFLTRINADGTLDNTFGTNGTTVTSVREGGEDNAKSLAVQTDGKIIVAGNQCGGMCTYILLRYNANAVSNPAGLTKVKENAMVSIFPNPVNETLQVKPHENMIVRAVSIQNLNGQKLIEQKEATGIDVSELSAGLYFVQVTTDKGISTQKFIKQ